MGRSLAHLRIEGAPTVDEWMVIIDQLMTECGIQEHSDQVHILYQQVTRGAVPRNHLFPAASKPVCTLNFRKAPAYSTEQREAGIALSSQPDERWNRCYIKAVSLLPVVLAKQAAVDAGAFEALMIRNGFVTEGGATNAYCVIDDTVYTHPEGPHILSGVVREMVLEAAGRAGVAGRETPVLLEDFRKAQEAFISSTTMDLMPCTTLDGKAIGTGQVGPIARRLMAALSELVAEELSGQVTATAVAG
jgi:D-alanine transaminase